MRFLKIFFLFSCLFLMQHKVFSQASWETFGQNRVQYRTFQWNYFDSTHFRTFYYDQGKPHALFALKMAEEELSHIVFMMGGRLNKKLNIIIYNSFTDYRQTNLGRKADNFNDASGGRLEVIGDNIPVYFDGDHLNLKKQIVKGIATVIKDNMLFGENIKDIVKNAVKMNLSDWYTNGYVSYIANEWTPEMNDEITTILTEKQDKHINEIALKNSLLVGHSFWRFIATKYGENQISNLLYLTRYRKSINASLQTVFKKPASEVYKDWIEFYVKNETTAILKDSSRNELIRITKNENATYSNFTCSPSGREIAFVEKKDGQYSIKLADIKFNNIKTIIHGGLRSVQDLADPDYPLLTWSPNGRKLAILYVKKGKLNVRIFTTGSQKMENRIIPVNKIERITGFCFMTDDNTLAITGIRKGASDLFKYTIAKNKVEYITNDFFDDKNPTIIYNGKFAGTLFLSNRTSSYLGEDSKSDNFNDYFNLFIYQPAKGNNLISLTHTKTAIQYPIQWGENGISYFVNEDGKLIRKVISTDTKTENGFEELVSAPLLSNTIFQEYLHSSQQIIEVVKNNKEYIIYGSSYSQRYHADTVFRRIIDTVKNEIIEKEIEALPEYQIPFEEITSTKLDEIFTEKSIKKNRYQNFTESKITKKPIKYKPSFTQDFIQTSLDNTLLFTRYQPLDPNNPSYNNPPVSGFLTTSLIDVMEDYKITVGARLGTNFSELDYFFKFNNFRKRGDWELIYFRHNSRGYEQYPSTVTPYGDVFVKNLLDNFLAKYTYPLDITKSISLQTGIRYDRKNPLATERYSINIENAQQAWTIGRLEYIFDNSYKPILNIRKGSRAKVFAEYQYQITNEKSGFYTLGYDARHYSTLYKNIIFATRIAGANSGGTGKMLYKLGGVDNDLNPKQDASTIIDYTQNYSFQTLATNVRGYRQGFINGSSYLILNEEIRIPIYNTFFNRPIKSGFIRELQLVGFADYGMAWKGFFPNDKNTISLNAVKNPDTNVTLYLENSFGLSYGAGLRTKLLGYFVRSDFAWNLSKNPKPIIHFSLATDF